MSNQLSCIQTTVACLPVVGSVVSIYKAGTLSSQIDECKFSGIGHLHAQGAAGTALWLNQQQAVRGKHIALLEEVISYHKCGITSNLLTVAGLIAAIALGILGGQLLVLSLTSCGVLLALHGVFLSGHSESLRRERRWQQDDLNAGRA
jgi:hypothetical protein